MKKLVSLTVSLVIMVCFLTCSGCGSEDFHFLQDQSQISSIEIVSIKYAYDANTDGEEILVCKIENVSEFLEDFCQIEHDYVHPPNRNSYLQRQTVVKITYNNAEYEWISPVGNTCFRLDGSDIFYGSGVLDDKQFAELITKYVAEDNIKLEYNFLKSNTEISSIEIVKLGEWDEERGAQPPDQTVVGNVENVSEFLDSFSEMDCYFNAKYPTRVRDNSIAIKINYTYDDYREGDYGLYELIDAYGQSICVYDQYFAINGYRYFDKNQFSNLIKEYINK